MKYDLVVVGGGPAGISAALTASKHGARVAVVDENPTPGGKLLGQLYKDATDGWWIGEHIAKQLADEAIEFGVDLFLSKEVWGVFPGWQVMLSSGEKLQAPYLLVATGEAEHTNHLPAWMTPGVMANGAAQTLTIRYSV